MYSISDLLYRILSCLLAIAFPAWALAQSTQKAPHSLVHDFGIVNKGDTVRAQLEFLNPLGTRVDGVTYKVSCNACTRLLELPAYAESNDTLSFQVELDSTKKSGLIHETVLIYSKIQQSILAEVILSARVRGIWVEPPLIEFGDVTEAVERRTVRVLACGYKEPRILSSDGDNAAIKMHLESRNFSAAEGDLFSIRELASINLELEQAALKLGANSGQLVLQSNIAEFPKLEVNVTAMNLGAVRSYPKRVTFGAHEPGSHETRDVKLLWKQSSDNIDFTKFTVSSTHEWMTSIIVPGTNPSEAILKLDMKLPLDVSGKLEGVIIGQLDDMALFRIPYLVICIPNEVQVLNKS